MPNEIPRLNVNATKLRISFLQKMTTTFFVVYRRQAKRSA